MALPLVYLFNASSNLIYIYTNGAAPNQAISAPGTSPTLLWVPQSPATQPTFTNTPQAGTFGWGNNTVTVQVAGGTISQAFTISIPQNTQLPMFSVEIYLFYQSVNSVSWMVLGDGTPVSGTYNLSLTS
jgi:hypothetical protein